MGSIPRGSTKLTTHFIKYAWRLPRRIDYALQHHRGYFRVPEQIDQYPFAGKFRVPATRPPACSAPLLVAFPEAAHFLHWLCEVRLLPQRGVERPLQSGVRDRRSVGEAARVFNGFCFVVVFAGVTLSLGVRP